MTKENDFYGQAFLLLYGVIMGLLAGTLGGFWSQVAFEYLIRKDTSLEHIFWVITICFISIVVVVSITMIYYLKKWKK
jgi:uncharacterized BrkB/YihY/UPF0761 family membrane protein